MENGKPPLLHFKHEAVLDAQKSERAVSYALLRIIPPEGVNVDPKRRSYIIIDPRAGHGPVCRLMNWACSPIG